MVDFVPLERCSASGTPDHCPDGCLGWMSTGGRLDCLLPDHGPGWLSTDGTEQQQSNRANLWKSGRQCFCVNLWKYLLWKHFHAKCSPGCTSKRIVHRMERITRLQQPTQQAPVVGRSIWGQIHKLVCCNRSNRANKLHGFPFSSRSTVSRKWR